ncbi:MAG: hypothetical protein NTY98_04825 [Verrucomicrobia bacterium]|nr:hypothetical protein [Verrucomicrobiota bacterium]
MTEALRVKCGICDSMILPTTAQANGGLCAQCVKIPPSRRGLAAAVRAEPNPFERALEMYSSLIDSLAMDSAGRDFGAIGDPEFTGVRFYSPDSVSGLPVYDESTELGSEAVDEIEHYLLADASDRSLFGLITTKLKAVSPAFNSAGKTVFVASMGMGVEEIAWLIRYLNDRPTFERFLNGAGITEEQVNVYNESYGQELNQAEQADAGSRRSAGA